MLKQEHEIVGIQTKKNMKSSHTILVAYGIMTTKFHKYNYNDFIR